MAGEFDVIVITEALIPSVVMGFMSYLRATLWHAVDLLHGVLGDEQAELGAVLVLSSSTYHSNSLDEKCFHSARLVSP
ncbi:hypothetical protein C0J08_21100 [Marinomonas sp. CT5]|nr:hypothetical protein C0J08_21100 [Marinomonas sp. CT5]